MWKVFLYECAKLIRDILSYLLLSFYNKRNNNRVLSKYTSYKVSMKHNNIVIMPMSVVDIFSDIGSYTYIGFNCFISNAKIGRYVSIANNVSIGMGEHDISRIHLTSVFYSNPFEELTKELCSIGNDVWIGTESVILRGVKIGNGAVVGANSVVTRDVQPYAVVVGSPARVIKYRFSEEKIKYIDQLAWWDLDIPAAKKCIESLGNGGI